MYVGDRGSLAPSPVLVCFFVCFVRCMPHSSRILKFSRGRDFFRMLRTTLSLTECTFLEQFSPFFSCQVLRGERRRGGGNEEREEGTPQGFPQAETSGK